MRKKPLTKWDINFVKNLSKDCAALIQQNLMFCIDYQKAFDRLMQLNFHWFGASRMLDSKFSIEIWEHLMQWTTHTLLKRRQTKLTLGAFASAAELQQRSLLVATPSGYFVGYNWPQTQTQKKAQLWSQLHPIPRILCLKLPSLYCNTSPDSVGKFWALKIRFLIYHLLVCWTRWRSTSIVIPSQHWIASFATTAGSIPVF